MNTKVNDRAIICTARINLTNVKNVEGLDPNDLLENIKLLLNYITKLSNRRDKKFLIQANTSRKCHNMAMPHQIILIHGGHALDTREDFLNRLKTKAVIVSNFKPSHKWTDTLQEKLGPHFEVFAPRMPNKENARYEEWKAWFERMIPFLKDDATFVGHSLGGLFLIKYLSENVVPKKIKALILVAVPYDGKNKKHTYNTNFIFGNDISGVTNQVKDIVLFHSTDDVVVPFSDFETYKELFPSAVAHTFKDQNHFNELEFPEIFEEIKKRYK